MKTTKVTAPSRISLSYKHKGQLGVSLVEILIVLALAGVLAVMALSIVLTKPQNTWSRVAEDYVKQLAATYNKCVLQHGDSPINAVDVNGATLYTDGLASILQDWETIASYSSASPAYLSYPSKIRVYVNPEDTNVPDTSNQLPIHQAGTPAIIMADTSNSEWLLLDINGADAPNSLATDGDRVLLIVDDATGRVLTAWQKCQEALGNTPPYAGTTCTLTATAPDRTYYKSFYDVYKGL